MQNRYFFNLYFPSEFVVDAEGVAADNLEAAKSDALEIIRELAADYANSGSSLTLLSIEICDAHSRVVASITTAEALNGMAAPLIGPSNIETYH